MRARPPPVRLGAISNPIARRNQDEPAVLRSLCGRPEIPVVIYRGGGGLAAEISHMALCGVTDLIVDGGDGTVIATISAALQVRTFAVPPRFILVPSGTTNLIAERIGAKVSRVALIDRLLRMTVEEMEARTIIHAPMQVDRGEGCPRLHGFLLGAAAYRSGVLLSQNSLGRLGLTRRSAIAAGIVASAWRAAWAADRAKFLAGEPLGVEVDGIPLPGERQFLLLVSALDKLMMGLKPFWGQGSGPLRWLNVAASPRGLVKALPRVLLGRPGAWMHEAGYRSGRVAKLGLSTREPFVLDGEIIQPGETGRVEISAGPPMRFLQLA